MEKQGASGAAAKGPAFVLKKVNVTGSTVFAAEEFRPAYKRYEGTEVTFSDLEAIAAAVKARYKAKGYLTTDVYIPEQNIAGGTVEIRVSEGRMGVLKVEGNRWFSAPLLESYIHSRSKELLNIFSLQRDMLRLNQNPDLEVSSVLAPGKDPGTTDIVLKAAERFPYHAGASVDNQGSRLVGKVRRFQSLRASNLSGLNDSFSVNAMSTTDSTGGFVSYAVPLGTYGTTAGLDLTAFTMKLGKEFIESDITGTTLICTPHISRELYLSPDLQAYAELGMDLKSVKKKERGDETTNDQLRMPFVFFDLTEADSILGGGQTVFEPRISYSLSDELGASSRNHPSASRPDSGGRFFKYDQTLRRVQRGPLGSFFSARSEFLVASHTLPSSEQLQIGGANSVRGYPEGEYLADLGATLSTEWTLPAYFIPESVRLPRASIALRHQLQPAVFVDMGGGKLKKTGPGEQSHRFLMGAGCGLRFQFNSNFYFRLDWAKRLSERPGHGQGPSTFYMTFQLEI